MGAFGICIFFRTECLCFLFAGGGGGSGSAVTLSEVLKILFLCIWDL